MPELGLADQTESLGVAVPSMVEMTPKARQSKVSIVKPLSVVAVVLRSIHSVEEDQLAKFGSNETHMLQAPSAVVGGDGDELVRVAEVVEVAAYAEADGVVGVVEAADVAEIGCYAADVVDVVESVDAGVAGIGSVADADADADVDVGDVEGIDYAEEAAAVGVAANAGIGQLALCPKQRAGKLLQLSQSQDFLMFWHLFDLLNLIAKPRGGQECRSSHLALASVLCVRPTKWS